MFAVCVTFEIVPDRWTDFLERMRRQAERSLAVEPGCVRFDVWTDTVRPGAVFLYELYVDANAFDLHLKSAHFVEFDAATTDMLLDKSVVTWDRGI